MGPHSLFGLDVRGLDVEGFTLWSRGGFALAVLVGLALARRRAEPRFVVAFAALGGVVSWWITSFPLARLYALDVGADRTANIQLVQVVAAGNPWWSSGQPGQFSFEPFWGLLVATLSGFEPARVIPLYAFLPLLPILLFPLALYRGLDGAALDDWERAFMAYFAALLLGTAIDFRGPFRDPWQMTFLFKPNHALGLVLMPPVLAAFARARSRRAQVGTGLALGVLGWVCVFHMVLVWAGLCALAACALARWERTSETVTRVACTGLTSLAVCAPYLYVLLFLYPASEPGPRYGNSMSEAWALLPTLQAGPLFLLALVGGREWARRRSDLARTWVALAIGALAFWALLYVLGLSFRARERDEVFYWLRVITATLAGLGAWHVMGAILDASGRTVTRATRAALLVILTLPFVHPMYWTPATMDPYFRGSLEPLPPVFGELGHALMESTAPADVIACDPDFGRYVSAFAARRVYFSRNLNNTRPEAARREDVLRDLLGLDMAAACAAARAAGVRHLVLTPEWVDELGLDLERFRADGAWRLRRRVGAALGERADWAEIYALECPRS